MRIGIIYLLSGFGGSVLSALFIRNSISVGASGALFGILGAMLAELITNWSIYTNKVECSSLLYVFFMKLNCNHLLYLFAFADCSTIDTHSDDSDQLSYWDSSSCR